MITINAIRLDTVKRRQQALYRCTSNRTPCLASGFRTISYKVLSTCDVLGKQRKYNKQFQI
jgi:hypothetical protein